MLKPAVDKRPKLLRPRKLWVQWVKKGPPLNPRKKATNLRNWNTGNHQDLDLSKGRLSGFEARMRPAVSIHYYHSWARLVVEARLGFERDTTKKSNVFFCWGGFNLKSDTPTPSGAFPKLAQGRIGSPNIRLLETTLSSPIEWIQKE